MTSPGTHFMPAAVTSALLGAAAGEWDRFRRHWAQLGSDRYASEQGTRRSRRYGRFSVTAATGRIELLPQESFVQPEDSNPLYHDVERTFEPLTDAFLSDPLFEAVLRLLEPMAATLDDPPVWTVKAHPFRVLASADALGLPTPEGLHRDGVTLVSSLLVGRENAVGGESTVRDQDGRLLLTATLSEPGDLLLGDDRRTLHSVSPVRPVRPDRPACRDVLVVTFVPG